MVLPIIDSTFVAHKLNYAQIFILEQMEINFSNPYYKLLKEISIGTLNEFRGYENWVKGEFDLCLQEKNAGGLKVHVPNGWVEIRASPKNRSVYVLEILVANKSRQSCQCLVTRMLSIHDHFKTVFIEQIYE